MKPGSFAYTDFMLYHLFTFMRKYIFPYKSNAIGKQIAAITMIIKPYSISRRSQRSIPFKPLEKKWYFIADKQTKVVELVTFDSAYWCYMAWLSFLFHHICFLIYMDPDYNSPLIYWWGYCNLSILINVRCLSSDTATLIFAFLTTILYHSLYRSAKVALAIQLLRQPCIFVS